jgi:hypothetical protein
VEINLENKCPNNHQKISFLSAINEIPHSEIPSRLCCEKPWILGPKRDEVTRGRRKLQNEVLHNFYSSPYFSRMMKSGRVRWAGM